MLNVRTNVNHRLVTVSGLAATLKGAMGLAGAVGLMGLGGTSTAHAQTFTWNNPAGGNWNLAANWLPAGVPNGPRDSALLVGTSAYTVVLTDPVEIEAVEIADAATVAVPGGLSLGFERATGSGSILIKSDRVEVGASVFLSGPRAVLDTRVVLNARAEGWIQEATLSNGTLGDHRLGPSCVVTGRGVISHLDLVNQGLIEASRQGDHLLIVGKLRQAASGRMAVGGKGWTARMEIGSLDLRMDPGARVEIADGGVLDLGWGARTIEGGAIHADPGGVATGSSTLRDLEIVGDLIVSPWAGGSGAEIRLDAGVRTPRGRIVLDDGAAMFTGEGTFFDGTVHLGVPGVGGSEGSLGRFAGQGHSLGPNARVIGTGQIQHDLGLTSGGLISTESPGDTLFIGGVLHQSASGRVVAETGTKVIVGGTHTMDGGAEIIAKAGGTLQLHYGTINGGTIRIEPGAQTNAAHATLSNLTIEGDLGVESGGLIYFGQGVEFPRGRLVVNRDHGAISAYALIASAGTLSPAPIELQAGSNPPDSARLIVGKLGPMALVSGRGMLDLPAPYNEGVIVADGPGELIQIHALNQGATGLLTATDGGGLELFTGTITGGTLHLGRGGTVNCDQATLQNITVKGAFRIGGGMNVRLGPGVSTPDGEFFVHDGASNTFAYMYITGNGTALNTTITLDAPASKAPDRARIAWHAGAVHTFGPASTICGRGAIMHAPGLINHGTLSPGLAELSKEVDEIKITAVHTLTPTAKVNIDLGGATADKFDRLTGNATLNLDGTLTIDYIDGWVPAGNERLEIIKGSAINGEFADIIFNEKLSPTGPEQVFYTGNSVLVVMCYADNNGDGELTIDDFISFQTNFALGLPIADCDQDTILSIDDFICFQTLFALGC